MLRLAAQPGVPPDPLRHPSETTVFSFRTANGKTASLCEGPKGAYLVYRFGTAAKTELQYPAVLDASSWRKFTYSFYLRGGGAANAGMDLNHLSFKNGGAKYVIYSEYSSEDSKEEVGIEVHANGKTAHITGKPATVKGSLTDLRDNHKVTPSDEVSQRD
ncbi:MAG: hypothetical protein ACRYFX_03110 [Janthinobacterium lividum]